MGDRANVIVKENGEQVCLYTHWYGTELPETLRAALIRGISRWDDFPYLSRIIFCEMVKGNPMELSGHGISCSIGDGKDKVAVVDVDKRTVSINNRPPVSFDEYIKCEQSWCE